MTEVPKVVDFCTIKDSIDYGSLHVVRDALYIERVRLNNDCDFDEICPPAARPIGRS